MRRSRKPAWSPGQKAALAELRDLAAAKPHDIVAVGQPQWITSPTVEHAYLAVDVSLSTRTIDAPSASELLADQEDVTIFVGPRFPAKPPTVYVRHNRFVDVVHVLYGEELCIYLDEDREWHPSGGMRDVLEQIWKFLDNAANDRFDAATALFHPIGGRNPVTRGAPTTVVRRFPGIPGKPLSLGSATARTARRIDIEPACQERCAPSASCAHHLGSRPHALRPRTHRRPTPRSARGRRGTALARDRRRAGTDPRSRRPQRSPLRRVGCRPPAIASRAGLAPVRRTHHDPI